VGYARDKEASSFSIFHSWERGRPGRISTTGTMRPGRPRSQEWKMTRLLVLACTLALKYHFGWNFELVFLNQQGGKNP
jgi:hypothetical protein